MDVMILTGWGILMGFFFKPVSRQAQFENNDAWQSWSWYNRRPKAQQNQFKPVR